MRELYSLFGFSIFGRLVFLILYLSCPLISLSFFHLFLNTLDLSGFGGVVPDRWGFGPLWSKFAGRPGIARALSRYSLGLALARRVRVW
jgi:hypothetical protein